TEDGLVEWLGRSDGQVKVRGYRIEPGEIEAAIRRIDGIREAAVTARTEEGETALYAYIEGRKSDDVRAELATRLPAYMMPAQFIEMSEWPVTPSGRPFVKSDGSRLPHRQRVRCSGAVTGHLRPADGGRARFGYSGLGRKPV
ncbi:hypothetical protein LQ763_09370, partial [Bacillus velezensis]